MISSPVDRVAKSLFEISASRLKRAHSMMSLFFASCAIKTIFRMDPPPSLDAWEIAARRRRKAFYVLVR